MARTPKRAKAKSRHYRCVRCHAPIPTSYKACGNCGYSPEDDKAERFIRAAKRMFPGSHEL